MNRKRSFWKWISLWLRAGMIEEARRKKIMRENLATWNHLNRDFINKCNRAEAAHLQGPSADEESAVGYGSDSGDGSVM